MSGNPEQEAAQAHQTPEGVAAVAAEQAVLKTTAEPEEHPGRYKEMRSAVSPPWCEEESSRPESMTSCRGGSVVSADEGTESEPPQTQDVGASGSRRHEQSHDTEHDKQ